MRAALHEARTLAQRERRSPTARGARRQPSTRGLVSRDAPGVHRPDDPREGAPTGPPRGPSEPSSLGKFAAPPPKESGRFVGPIHEGRPVESAPVTYYDAPVTSPPRLMVWALLATLAISLLQMVGNAPSMLLLPGCAPTQMVFAVLVAITCWRGRSYGRWLAIVSLLAWAFAAALAIRGTSNMVPLLSFESVQRGEMHRAIRVLVVARAALEAGLVYALFRPDANRYFAHRAEVDRLGGRKWE